MIEAFAADNCDFNVEAITSHLRHEAYGHEIESIGFLACPAELGASF